MPYLSLIEVFEIFPFSGDREFEGRPVEIDCGLLEYGVQPGRSRFTVEAGRMVGKGIVVVCNSMTCYSEK